MKLESVTSACNTVFALEKEWKFAPLTIRDESELQKYITDKRDALVKKERYEKISIMKEQMAEFDLKPEEWSKILLNILNTPIDIDVNLLAMMPESDTMLLVLSAKHNHPSIDRNTVEKIIQEIGKQKTLELATKVAQVEDVIDFEQEFRKQAKTLRRYITNGKLGEAVDILNEMLGEPEYYRCDKCNDKVLPENADDGKCKCGGVLVRPPSQVTI